MNDFTECAFLVDFDFFLIFDSFFFFLAESDKLFLNFLRIKSFGTLKVLFVFFYLLFDA